MKMAWKPKHGEKFKWGVEEVTILRQINKNDVNVIFANGKLGVVAKKELNLPIIDTADYEKIS